jgi:hypothetical protein
VAEVAVDRPRGLGPRRGKVREDMSFCVRQAGGRDLVVEDLRDRVGGAADVVSERYNEIV